MAGGGSPLVGSGVEEGFDILAGCSSGRVDVSGINKFQVPVAVYHGGVVPEPRAGCLPCCLFRSERQLRYPDSRVAVEVMPEGEERLAERSTEMWQRPGGRLQQEPGQRAVQLPGVARFLQS